MFKVIEKNNGSLPKKRCASESGMCWVTGSLLTTYPPTIVRGDRIISLFLQERMGHRNLISVSSMAFKKPLLLFPDI